jgi:hypothetical protein
LSALEIPTQALWLPGQGFVPTNVRQAQQAVEEYDKDLTIGRHEQTGDWVILLKRGPEGRPFPVYGLGTELPAPEAIKKKLYEGDVRRHGGRIALKLEQQMEAKRRAKRADAEAATEEVAEAFLWAARKDGKANIPRIFVPGDKPKGA